MHGALLSLAIDIASRDVGQPLWVARNRAVSTAYYALFHALAELCARQLIGAWQPWDPFRHVYRSLDHGSAYKLFGRVRSDVASGPVLARVAEVFRQLQEQRHRADYDPGFRVSRAEALNAIDRAAEAVRLLDQLSASERKMLAAMLIGRTRL